MKVSELAAGLEKFQDWEVVYTGEDNRLKIRKGCVELERNGAGGWWATVYSSPKSHYVIHRDNAQPANTSAEAALARLNETINDAAHDIAVAVAGLGETKQ